MSGNPRYGLVLSGGASYGAYEVGVLSALSQGVPQTGGSPLQAEVIAGASTGAFNAAVLTAYSGGGMRFAAGKLQRLWIDRIASTAGQCDGNVMRYRINPANLLNLACTAARPSSFLKQLATDTGTLLADALRRGEQYVLSGRGVGPQALDLINIEALISGEPYRQLVQESVPLSAIRNAPVQLRIPATNWRTGAVTVFGNSDMTDEIGHDIVLASSATPGIFETVEIGGTPYTDGGVVMNTPLRPAIEAGADAIHLISVNPQVELLDLPKLPSTINTVYRTLSISLASAINRDIEILARINDGLRILEDAKSGKYTEGLSLQDLILTLGGLATRPLQNLPYKPLTVHRYQMAEPQDGFLQWLNFDIDRIETLIETGYRDALQHDCRLSGCVIPQ